MQFEELRQEYSGRPLTEAEASRDPFEQFDRWFAEAVRAGVAQPNGMALATADPAGRPSLRMVLLKEADPRGLVFFTNYGSRKADELERNPSAALLFYWEPLHRQIRIEGRVARVPAAESDAYFGSRPRAANLSALASAQSTPIESREALDERVRALDEASRGQPLVRPPSWGGYRLVPHTFEFWQGQADRLHDRLEYVLAQGHWQRQRLCP